MPSKPYDSTLKDLIEEHAADWAASFGQGPVTDVRLVDADVSTLTAAADKVICARGPSGDWLLNLEPHTSHDLELPRRLHLYNTVLGYRHGLPVRSVVVLLRREADSPGLTGEYRLLFPGEAEPYQLFRYQVARVWQMPLQPLLAGPLGTLPLATLTDDAEQVLPAVLGSVNERLKQEASQTDAERLLTATVLLMGLRYPLELTDQLLKGVSGMEESSTYQLIVSRGQIKEAKRFLLMQGEERFGKPDAHTVAAIESINDLTRLEELGRHLVHVDGWEQLVSQAHRKHAQ